MIQKLPDETVKLINRNLKDAYGSTEDKANFRLVWADDERELRWTDKTPEGLQLLTPEVREMRKYPDIRERYVLESMMVLSTFKEDGSPVEELRYTAIWMFEVVNDKKEKVYIAPNYGACKFIVETVMSAVEHRGSGPKYKDPESDPEEAKELKRQRIHDLEADLFGNESAVTDALSTRAGVAYGPGSSPNSSNPTLRQSKREIN